MQKRPITVSYIFFYLLFSEDTWRIAAGFIGAPFFWPAAYPGTEPEPGR